MSVIAKPSSLFGANIGWTEAMDMDVYLFNSLRKRIDSIRQQQIDEMEKVKRR